MRRNLPLAVGAALTLIGMFGLAFCVVLALSLRWGLS
jgi:hypothetical protein